MKIGFFKSWCCFAFQSKVRPLTFVISIWRAQYKWKLASSSPNFDVLLKEKVRPLTFVICFWSTQCKWKLVALSPNQTPHFCDQFSKSAMQMKIGWWVHFWFIKTKVRRFTYHTVLIQNELSSPDLGEDYRYPEQNYKCYRKFFRGFEVGKHCRLS